MRRFILPLLAVVTFFTLCAFLWNQAFRPKVGAVAEMVPDAAPKPTFVITKLDNGLVYIQAEGDDYLKALQAFYAENGNQYLHCDFQGAIEKQRNPGWKADGTHVFGYILRCHDIAVPAQDVTIP